MSELTPAWRKPKMTQSQVKAYIKQLEENKKNAQKKLDEAKKKWELDNNDELNEIEKKLNELF